MPRSPLTLQESCDQSTEDHQDTRHYVMLCGVLGMNVLCLPPHLHHLMPHSIDTSCFAVFSCLCGLHRVLRDIG